MLMSVCWKCGEIKQYNYTEELYLLITEAIICPCGAENIVTEELKTNIRTDWGLKKMSINKVILTGRLTKDVELRYTPSGVAVCTFTVASDTGYGDKKQTAFVPIVVWRQLAELCANALSKGSRVALEGRLSTRSYDNKEGKKVFVTEVIADAVEFLDPKKNDGPQDPFAGESKTVDINDDDLPF